MEGIIGRFFANERVNVHIEGGEDTNFVTEDEQVKETRDGLLNDPTMNVYTSQSTVDKIKAEEITIEEALKTGEIRFA